MEITDSEFEPIRNDQPFSRHNPHMVVHTPWKTNFSPENQWLQDAFPIAIVPFLGDMLVFWGVVFS